jgi:hypothetical protein
MSKSILEIETPGSCAECKLSDNAGFIWAWKCNAIPRRFWPKWGIDRPDFEFSEARAPFCPLKIVPDIMQGFKAEDIEEIQREAAGADLYARIEQMRMNGEDILSREEIDHMLRYVDEDKEGIRQAVEGKQ